MSDPAATARPKMAGTGFALVVVLLVAGLAVPSMISGLGTRSDSRPVSGGVTTTGTVTAVEGEGGAKGDGYTAVIQYADDAGTRHGLRSDSGDRRPTVGATVQVSYDPDHPDTAHDFTTGAETWKYQFFTGLVMLLIAIAMGAALVVVTRCRQTSSSRAVPPERQ